MTDADFGSRSWRQRFREAGDGFDLRAQAEEITRQSQERWAQLQEVHTAMRAVTETAVSARREVSATAVWGGAITEVKFPSAAYKRLPAAELGRLVQATVAAAQDKVTSAVATILTPTLPAGLDAEALLRGQADFTEVMQSRSGDWFADGVEEHEPSTDDEDV